MPATASAPTGGPDANDLAREHVPLVSYAVSELASRIPAYVSRDDLISAGMLGLVQAARGFDASRGVDFAVFAKARIRGALLDELRSRDWATRSVRGMARQAADATEALTTSLLRTPTRAEVADRLGVDAATLTQLSADVERATVLNYDSIVFGGDADQVLPATGVDPEAHLLAREKCNYLHDAVASLPDQMRSVVTGSFFEDRSLLDIAAELGLSESRISQIRSEALALLREGMDAALGSATAHAPLAEDRVGRRTAAYVAAVASASDYRTRLEAGSPAAEQVAVSGL